MCVTLDHDLQGSLEFVVLDLIDCHLVGIPELKHIPSMILDSEGTWLLWKRVSDRLSNIVESGDHTAAKFEKHFRCH